MKRPHLFVILYFLNNLIVVYLGTTFEDLSFSRSGDIDGVPKYES